LVGVLGLAGCSSGSSSGSASPTPNPDPVASLTGTAWNLTSYKGAGGSLVVTDPDSHAVLAFREHGMLAGSTGCNQFSGTYRVTATSLSIMPGAMTLIACADPALNAQESALLALFAKVTDFDVAADHLALIGAGETTLLTYAAGLPGVTGTSWIATGVTNGQGGVEATGSTGPPTAAFGADGAFTGFGGCNTLSGSYAVTGSSGLTFTDLVSTQKACTTAIDTLEAQYTAALGHATTYELSGDTLTLRNSAGEIQVTYRLDG
jgi:heat shock protein HslJ